MTCKFCQADLRESEHLPTEEAGTYWFLCGAIVDDNGQFAAIRR